MKIKNFVTIKWIFLSAISYCLSGTSLLAQDIHFSQYYASPLSLNPALTGFFSKQRDYRIAANYRNQWASIANPYVTYSGSADFQLYKNEFKNNDWLGGGIYFLKDKAGSGDLSMTKIHGSLAYHKSLHPKDDHVLSLGMQAVYANKSLDFNKLIFGNQLDDDGLNGQSNGEPITGNKINYIDLNMGVFLYTRLNQKLAFTSGVSLFHLLTPKESFLGNENNTLSIRPLYSIGSVISITDQIDLTPSLIYMRQQKAQEFHISVLANFRILTDEKSFLSEAILFGGLQFRGSNTDALVLVTGIEVKDVRVGISYDINVSDLTPATNGRGGVELSVIYLGAWREIKSEVIIPCFRF